MFSMSNEYMDESVDIDDSIFEDDSPPEKEEKKEEKKEVKEWVPDSKLTEGLDELKSSGVVYHKDEIQVEEKTDLKNMLDDDAEKYSTGAMDDMARKTDNIEKAKKRFGIIKLQVPPGVYQVRIYTAAGDDNTERAEKALDEIFKEIVEKYPEFVLEWEEGRKPAPVHRTEAATTEEASPSTTAAEENKVVIPLEKENLVPEDETTINVEKSEASKIVWNTEELEKIKKSRKINLNIIEDADLHYSEIEEVGADVVDTVLSKYVRKINDVTSPLPASKYRATFTGLSYPEVLDLTHSNELNLLDGERKKWSIAFDHMKNISIGDWESYNYYMDGNKKIRIEKDTTVPDTARVYHWSEFDDFLSKTSFIDLDFILWKILCASSISKEIVSVDCRARHDGKICGKSYDWIYSTDDLLVTDNIDKAVLKEMDEVAKAQSPETIQKLYKSSFLASDSVITLPHSKLRMVFGHISAYEYLNEVYGMINEPPTEEDEERKKPMIEVSKPIVGSMMTFVKAFLIRNNETGKDGIIRSKETVRKIIMQLDSYDFQTVTELMKVAIAPYRFTYALKNVRCPQCGNKSNIIIDNMSRMLFMTAQSLGNVQVAWKKA